MYVVKMKRLGVEWYLREFRGVVLTTQNLTAASYMIHAESAADLIDRASEQFDPKLHTFEVLEVEGVTCAG